MNKKLVSSKEKNNQTNKFLFWNRCVFVPSKTRLNYCENKMKIITLWFSVLPNF